MGVLEGNTILVEAKEVIDRGRTPMGYDLVIIYRMLKFIKEHEGCSIKELVEGVSMSFSTASKYVDFLNDKGLVEIRGLKPKRLYITRKGYDFLFLMTQISNLLGTRIE